MALLKNAFSRQRGDRRNTRMSRRVANSFCRNDLFPTMLAIEAGKPIDIDKETFKRLTGPFPAPAWLKVTTNHDSKVDHEMGSRPRVTGHHHGPGGTAVQDKAKVSGVMTGSSRADAMHQSPLLCGVFQAKGQLEAATHECFRRRLITLWHLEWEFNLVKDSKDEFRPPVLFDKALWVTRFRNIERDINKDLEEREISSFMQPERGILSALNGLIKLARTNRPESAMSTDNSPTRRMFSSRSSGPNPRSPFKPWRTLSPSSRYA